MATHARVKISGNGEKPKTEARPVLSELRFPSQKPALTKSPQKKESRYGKLTEAQKVKKREYAMAWHRRRAAQAKKEKLPYPFKHCPDCATPMPTVTHNNRTFLRPCRYCPDCGYEIPLMPKARLGGG